MSFDFEAVIGHLYMVSGRSINASPPGLLVEAAPNKAARGREMDTFFALVLPAGENPAPASFYERMAQLAAEEYFNSSGSVTAGIRTLFTKLNQNLYEHNEAGRRPYEANMICAILHSTDVFLARVGGGVAMLHSRGENHYFPDGFAADGPVTRASLGVHPVPDIKMTHYRLSSGARLILSDNNIIDFDAQRVQSALTMDNLGEVILGFKVLAQHNLTLLAVEFVPPEEPVPLALKESHSTRTGGDADTEAPDKAKAAQPAPKTNRVLGETNYQVRRNASAVALKLADGMDTLNTVTERISQKASERPGRFSNFLGSSSVVLIPVALVVLVLFMWLSGTGASEFELCVAEANKGASLARSIASNDVTGTLAAWEAVIVTVERCNELRSELDPQLQELTREGQSVIDQLNEIERREVTVIESFPSANLTSAVLRGEDLYVLDDGNDQVYRITLDEGGLNMVPNTRQPIATMRRGAGVGQFTLSDLVDIAWAEDSGGLSQGNVLLALDESGVLVEYSPTFLARGVQRLLGAENWGDPSRIKLVTWGGRLYLLDPGADQIWRYDPSGGAFPGAPLEYFTGANRPALENAVDFAIDDNGRVYVLFADGVIAMFRGGEELNFGFAGFPSNQSITSANAMFLSTNPVAQGIYITDRPARTIFSTSSAGTFNTSYRAFNESLFDGLSDVVVDDNKRVIYALSGNSVLAFSK